MALEHFPLSINADQLLLSKQRDAKRKKEKIAHELGMKNVTEQYIDSLYYNDKYGSSACWMKVSDVDKELKKLKSKSAKLWALKENIRIRVIGLGWNEFSHPWSKNGIEYSPNELAEHLKKIIKAEKRRVIPRGPPTLVPQRKNLPSLGEQTMDVKTMNVTSQEKNIDFDRIARTLRIKRESRGQGDRYAELQPTSLPKVDHSLLGSRLDVCFEFKLDEGGKELRWC